MTDLADPEAQAVAWDLDDLLDGAGPRAGDPAGRRRRHARRGPAPRRPTSPPPTPAGSPTSTAAGSTTAMRELAELQELVGRAGSYAMLSFSIDTADPARGALLQRVQEQGTAIETALLFFELEWAALDDEQRGRAARRRRPRLLPPPPAHRPPLPAAPALRARGEDRWPRRRSAAAAAWDRLFDEQASAITVELEDEAEPVALDVALSRLFSPERDGAPRDRRGGHRRRWRPACARAPTSSTRCWPTR